MGWDALTATEGHPEPSPVAEGAALVRALLGVGGDRLVDLVLDELPERDVRLIALVLLGAEHPRFVNSSEDLFGDCEPLPATLERLRARDALVARLESIFGIS